MPPIMLRVISFPWLDDSSGGNPSVIRVQLKDGSVHHVAEAVIANLEGDYLVCRDWAAKAVFRISSSLVAAYGKPDRKPV
jgi:hypothetical protein